MMRLGILGMWHSHAQGLVRAIAAQPADYQLVAAWDPEPDVVAERGKAWRTLVPGLKVLERPEDVLAEKLDGVAVEGRVHQNLRHARMALEAGYPVLLEKPAGHDLKEYREVVELARRKHLHLQMLYIFRYMSATREVLRRATSGELGDVYLFRARLPKDLAEYDRFVEELKLYRGGIFFEMAGHVIDMMVSVLGKPRKVTPFLGHHHGSPEKPRSFVDDGIAVFEFERAWGVIEVPNLEVATASRRIEVFGTKGACVVPHLGSGHLPNKDIQPVEVFLRERGRWETLELKAAELHAADLREFAASVARTKEPEYPLEHDVAVHEALLEASGMA